MTGFKNLTYEMARSCGGLQIAKVLSRHHPKIFMYHRISNGEPGLGLSVTQFRQHIAIIKKEFKPMTLSALLSAKEQGTIPANAVVVTFDDGYADFSEIAFPILKEAEIPVTLFVTTGFVNRDVWLWPDQIRFAIEETRKKKFRLSSFDKVFDIKAERHIIWSEISNFCLRIPTQTKLSLIEELFRELEVIWPKSIPEKYKPLSWSQIRRMVAEGLDIGSHSVSHPILTNLSDEQLLYELKSSKLKIEREVNKKVSMFCYPNGSELDFDAKVKVAIKKCEYKYGICAYPGRSPIRDRWCVNRYPIGEDVNSFLKNIYGLSYLAMRK